MGTSGVEENTMSVLQNPRTSWQKLTNTISDQNRSYPTEALHKDPTMLWPHSNSIYLHNPSQEVTLM
jgi:hypothetical protein